MLSISGSETQAVGCLTAGDGCAFLVERESPLRSVMTNLELPVTCDQVRKVDSGEAL
jgi:hypothetical protein